MPMSPWSFLSNCVSQACGNCSIRSTGIFSLLSISGSFVHDENQWNASYLPYLVWFYMVYTRTSNDFFKISCAKPLPVSLKKYQNMLLLASIYDFSRWHFFHINWPTVCEIKTLYSECTHTFGDTDDISYLYQ